MDGILLGNYKFWWVCSEQYLKLRNILIVRACKRNINPFISWGTRNKSNEEIRVFIVHLAELFIHHGGFVESVESTVFVTMVTFKMFEHLSLILMD